MTRTQIQRRRNARSVEEPVAEVPTVPCTATSILADAADVLERLDELLAELD